MADKKCSKRSSEYIVPELKRMTREAVDYIKSLKPKKTKGQVA